MPRILVIDDEKIIRRLLSRTLGERGYEIETAEDGSVALEKIKRNFFNLLIVDLKMPNVDGMDVLKEIKKSNPYIEVIILTGYPTVELAVKAIKMGAFDFIRKPFDIQEMESTVSSCLEKQKFAINHIELSELITFFEISKRIIATTSLDSFLELILDVALGVVKAKRGSLLLLDERTKELNIKMARGLSEEKVISNTRIELGEGICDRVVREKKPVLVTDIEQDPRFQKENKSQYETKSFLSIPLVSKYPQENVLGVINITDKISGESFTGREQTLLSVLAGQAVAAIENYKLYNQLQDKIEDSNRIIKELNETQNQLIQSEKMAAVGQLASGIAHEIRSPLAIIQEGVEFLGNSLQQKDRLTEESIQRIKHCVDRANIIIIELLKFSKISELKLQSVNICELLESTIGLIRNQANLSNVKIIKNFPEKDIQIKADYNMLQQAFFNLCINAIDAMPKGGRLGISMYWEKAKKGKNKVIIEIKDTGKGIPKDKLSKIFDPFFTTKEPAKGTGLGLSIVRLILERHKATIEVESQVGKGTKFIIKLPASKNA